MASAKTNGFDELKIIHETTIGDMRFSKLQMWRTMYLTILSIAALLGLYAQIKICLPLFIIVAVSIGLGGVCLVKNHNDSTKRYRYHLNEINKRLFDFCLKEGLIKIEELKEPRQRSNFYRNEIFYYMFIIVIILALVFSIIGLVYLHRIVG